MDDLETLTSVALDDMWNMFANGPVWDGNLVSKRGRDQLVRLGLAERYRGWNWLTREGVEASVDAGFGDRKDKRDRDRERIARR